jgi:dipicolinate synthase subunit B
LYLCNYKLLIDYEKKPNSMVAKMELLPETISAALEGKQLQPVVRG